MLDKIQLELLKEVADLDALPQGAVNIRANGKAEVRNSTANIEITPKEEGNGVDIDIKPGTKNESVHIPVVISKSGMTETVYNDFYVGDDCDVIIVAGCGIDNCGGLDSEHDGVHRFQVGKNSKVKYIEKHYGSGTGTGKRILNPVTEVHLGENSVMEMQMTQIKGVNNTDRKTVADLAAGAKLMVRERLMTHEDQIAYSSYKVDLNGDGSSADIVSRGVARDSSHQTLNLGIS
ncbi:MAG: SufD family Fe-S cluster assembly protein, partial [Coriobacteriales bacterium]